MSISKNVDPELIEVKSIKTLPNYLLLVSFADGTTKEFDFKPYLNKSVYIPLNDEIVFKSVYIESGIPMWCNGMIDIAPERLYNEGSETVETNK